MQKLGKVTAGAMIAATMLYSATANAQSGTTAPAPDTTSMGTTGAMGSSNDPFAIKPLSSEEIAANADKSVVIHFIGGVGYTSAMSLVYMIQNYYRNGHRRFIIPIMSGGGLVDHAMYAYESLSRMPIEITTVAIGAVDSAGVLLYCMGEKRYVTAGASFLFHPMRGSVNSDRRTQEADETLVESRLAWIDGVNADCFGEIPEKWDVDRRDYRVLAEEASEIGLANSGSDYFEAIGEVGAVSYVQPSYFGPTQGYPRSRQ